MASNVQPNGLESKKVKRNQFGEIVEHEEPLTIEVWEQRWDAGQTKFTLEVVHPMLIKFHDLLINGKADQRIFLPLCGKSLDMKWLADQGCDVVGNEVVQLACKQFFEEHELEYTEELLSTIPGSLFKSKSPTCRISIYCCDFYKLTRDIIGTFDGIWDRGSLVAIDPGDRQKYSQVITNLMNSSTKYILDAFIVDTENFAGPPFDLPEDEVEQLFGSWCDLKRIDQRDALNDRYRSWGMKRFIANVLLITLKQTKSEEQ